MKITDIHYPWRDQWRPASFGGAQFFVETDQFGGGRRVVLHQFPKRDVPYAEDLGREAHTFSITGYLIGPNYKNDRDLLEAKLDQFGPQTLSLPTRPDMQVLCARYHSTERRQFGGYCEVEMTFTEAGLQPSSSPVTDTTTQVTNAADNAAQAAKGYQTASAAFNGTTIFGTEPATLPADPTAVVPTPFPDPVPGLGL